MYNLLKFLKKYYNILLFLLLEALCILFLIYNLPYQKRKLTNVGNSISGKFYKVRNNFGSYFHLRNENKLLTEHNAKLMNLLSINTNDTIPYIYQESDYSFIPANVINNSIYRTNNFILIDKGKKHGINVDMGVVCENGIVGKIVNVTENYASAISLLHPYSIVSARFLDNQHLANVCWDNQNYRFGLVKDIPLHLNPKKGDTLVTSGFSNIYPPDIMIGTIEEMTESNSKDFNTAKIQFSTNFSTLRHVYVICNNNKTEIDSIASYNE